MKEIEVKNSYEMGLVEERESVLTYHLKCEPSLHIVCVISV